MLLNFFKCLLLILISVVCIDTTPVVKDYITFTYDLPDQDSQQKIPKTFHHIWLDFGKGDNVWPDYINNVRLLKELHPSWEYVLWTEPEITSLLKTHYPWFYKTWASYDMPIKKHDSARIAILHCYGGVYVDHDFLPLRNIEPLLKSYNFVAGNEKLYFEPCNGFMASVKDFRFLERYLEEMCLAGVAEAGVLDATGPYIFRYVLQKFVEIYGLSGVKIYRGDFFYPIGWCNQTPEKYLSCDQLRDKYPNCYLFHLYDYTWQDQLNR